MSYSLNSINYSYSYKHVSEEGIVRPNIKVVGIKLHE